MEPNHLSSSSEYLAYWSARTAEAHLFGAVLLGLLLLATGLLGLIAWRLWHGWPSC